ncbi:hypothetical protein KSU1_D0272 [Candidatus Jettenia caeni]|uniref:Uncharacterized protein n=1 Tax=Candidatus Jettenia caeni TaxID=247490 RepID=I3IPD6_9BACT|nr:hypothetical protein KSU1_D0272 [Candidatus Jettenia caeni]
MYLPKNLSTLPLSKYRLRGRIFLGLQKTSIFSKTLILILQLSNGVRVG